MIDWADYAMWKLHFGETAPGSGSGAGGSARGISSGTVPEPAIIVLVCIAMIALVGVHRKE